MEPGTFDGQNLENWALTVGWRVKWNLHGKDWAVPNRTTFTGTFHDVAAKVLTDMAAQGANLRAHFWNGNNTLVVYVPGESDAP
jgi:hypothetical protein